MAFALRIVAKTENDQEVNIEPSWWNLNELRKNYNFKEEIEFYDIDYILYVDKKTFIKIVDSQEKYRDMGVYEYIEWKNINTVTKFKIDKLILTLKEKDLVKIWLFEWESGM